MNQDGGEDRSTSGDFGSVEMPVTAGLYLPIGIAALLALAVLGIVLVLWPAALAVVGAGAIVTVAAVAFNAWERRRESRAQRPSA